MSQGVQKSQETESSAHIKQGQVTLILSSLQLTPTTWCILYAAELFVLKNVNFGNFNVIKFYINKKNIKKQWNSFNKWYNFILFTTLRKKEQWIFISFICRDIDPRSIYLF